MNQAINYEVEQTIVNRKNIFSRFLTWAINEEPNRIGWAAFAMVAHGAAITPITIAIIIITGNYFPFWIITILAMASTVITNLAALPTRYTIPTFFLSIVVDLIVILSCITMIL